MKLIVTCLAVLLSASTAFAWAPRAQVHRLKNYASSNDWNLLEAVALTAAAGSRTITRQLASADGGGDGLGDGWAQIKITIDYTYSAATAVTVTPSCSLDGGNTYGRETSTSISSGTGTISLYTDSYTTGGASAVLNLAYDVSGCTHVKLVFAGTGSPAAGDLIDVQAALVVGE